MRRLLTGIVMSAILAMATTVNAAPYMGFPITVDFDFTTGAGLNPAPFAPTVATPRPDQPSLSASASTSSTPIVTGFPPLVGTVFTPGTPDVNQTGLGLGVQSNGVLDTYFFGLTGSVFITEPALTGGVAVDNFGTDLDELLTLTYTNDDPFLVSSQVLGVGLLSFDDTPDPDIEIFVDGLSVGLFSIDGIPGGVLDLAGLGIFLAPGQDISFASAGGDFDDAFTVTGLQLELVMNPEPMSLALWGVVALCGSGGLALRRRKLTRSNA